MGNSTTRTYAVDVAARMSHTFLKLYHFELIHQKKSFRSERTQRFLGVRNVVVEKYFLFVPNEWSVIHSTFVTADTLGTVISSAIAGCKKWPSFWSRTAIQTRKYCWGNIVSFSFSGIAKSAERKQNVVLSRWLNEATIGPFYLTKNSGVNFRIRVANGTEFSRRLQQSEKR